MARVKKKKSNFLLNLITAILICIIAFSGFKLGRILYEYHKGTQEYKKIEKIANVKVKKEGLEIDWDKLLKKNKDVKGWIHLKDTVINYPIVQGDDNSFYLHRLLNKTYNFKGTIFIDYRIAYPFKSFNTIIYGHRMKDGSMFKPLIKYKDKDFYNKHKTIDIATPKAQYKAEVFAVATIPAESPLYKFEFPNQEEKEEFLSNIYSKSEIDTGVKVKSSDKVIMLSTCTYEFDEARFIVFAKLVKR